MNKKLILIALTITAASLFFLGIYNPVSYDTKKIDMHLTVGSYTGFNVDSDAVYFGTIMPYGIVTRTINITNLDKMSLVNMKVYGDMKGWIYVSENNFILGPNENKDVRIMIYVPKDAEYKNYEGELKIRFIKQK